MRALAALALLLGAPLLGAKEPTARTTIPADVVRRAMLAGQPINIRHSTIVGPLMLDGPATVHGPIEFDDVEFRAPVRMKDITFGNRVVIHKCKFRYASFDGTVMELSLSNTVFEEGARFDNAVLPRLNLEDVEFRGDASFRNTEIGQKPGSRIDDPVMEAVIGWESYWGNVHFHHDADFTEAHIGTLLFPQATFDRLVSFQEMHLIRILAISDTSFPREALFEGIVGGHASKLRFALVVFRGRAFFQGTSVNELQFGEPVGKEVSSGLRAVRAAKFEDRAFFRGITIGDLLFQHTEFRDYADFDGATIHRSAAFIESTFEREANFAGATLPPTLILDYTRFLATQNLRWKQVENCVGGEKRASWSMLEDSFRRMGNLEAMNGAMFAGRQLDSRAGGGGCIEEYFWGYGVRPLRVAGWIAVLFILFTAIYATQVGWRAAVPFSARTAVRLDYGYKNAVTPVFKMLTVAESLGMKVMAIFFVKSLANTSPLLNDIVSKLVHF